VSQACILILFDIWYFGIVFLLFGIII